MLSLGAKHGDMFEMETIIVTCRAKEKISLNDLTSFQGELKSLSKLDFEKLKASILRYGISFPFFVYRHTGKYYILDGHQRVRVLRELRDGGYQIPKLPVDFIEAKNKKEAKEKILLLSSQYGKLTEETLHNFIVEAELDFPELKELIQFPGIDLDHFDKGWMSDETEESNSEDQPKQVTCPECGHKFET